MKKMLTKLLSVVVILVITCSGCANIQVDDEQEQEEIDFNAIITELQTEYVNTGMDNITGWSQWNFNDFKASKDGKTLIVEMNRLSEKNREGYSRFMFIELVNDALGFGEALNSKMSSTRPIDGVLVDENDKIKVSWSYNAKDEILHIIYETK